MRRLVIAFALAGALVAPAAATASPDQETLLMDDNRLLYRGDEVADRTLDELKGLGVDRVRVSVIWRYIAPATKPANFDGANPAAYDTRLFDPYDHLVRAAAKRGIGILFNPTGGGPKWAVKPQPRGLQVGAPGPVYKPNAKEYGRFVQALGRRYSGTYADENQGRKALPRVATWSLWNEPNWRSLLQPQTEVKRTGKGRSRRTSILHVSPILYRGLVRNGTAGLARSGHGGDTVLLGETSPRGTKGVGPGKQLAPGLFLRELFCLDAKLRPLRGAQLRKRSCDFSRKGALQVTGYAHHPYSLTDRPDKPAPKADEISLADLGKLATILDAAARAGRLKGTLPIWVTEHGYESKPDPKRGLDPLLQARFNTRATRITMDNPRVAAYTHFLLRDDEPQADRAPSHPAYWSTYQSGLEYADGRKKPAYDAFRTLFDAPDRVGPGRPLALWGVVRPATGPVTVRIESKPAGAPGWTPVAEQQTDAAGRWTAQLPAAAAGEYRVQWNGPLPPRKPPTPVQGILGQPGEQPPAPSYESAPVAVAVG